MKNYHTLHALAVARRHISSMEMYGNAMVAKRIWTSHIRYILSVKVVDGLAPVNMKVFDVVGNELLGMTANDLLKLKVCYTYFYYYSYSFLIDLLISGRG